MTIPATCPEFEAQIDAYFRELDQEEALFRLRADWIEYNRRGGKLTYTEFAASAGFCI